MGSSSGGVGGSSGGKSGGSTSGGNSSGGSSKGGGTSGGNKGGGSTSGGNDRPGGGRNDRDSSSDRSSKNSSQSSKSGNSGNHETERAGISGSKKGSFDIAMSAAANNAGSTFGGLANDKPASTDADRAADEAAQNAARDSFAHANKFSGLGPSGNASFNSHRGYGPDGPLAGGIDRNENAGLGVRADDEKAPADDDDFVGDVSKKGTLAQAGIETVRNTVDYQARQRSKYADQWAGGQSLGSR